jgi:hypothetical protein
MLIFAAKNANGFLPARQSSRDSFHRLLEAKALPGKRENMRVMNKTVHQR